ncbi:urease accessory protein UreD [Piscinibacter sp.]|uniref:urease accessory protein UreD n=1 Tax=Piscinibacter sp. TaxID=1903157 RepID=UPI002B7747B7|nr:urease accessory protein UreD [Albitalea sp.]HUG22104.1 urease accessory protein UreD [Albitalea sp.]
MGWHGRLDLRYRRDADRTVVHDRHSGPLRILKSLYPESPGICHNVLVHPPSGIVGGDRLEIDVALAAGSHALITTPGATRFYRSAGALAEQSLTASLADGARLEWLPLETICHPGTLAENRMRFELAAGAEMIGWDILALGLPASGEPFDRGRFTQQIELPGAWLERGTVDGADTRLLDSPLGFAGHRVMATAWMAGGSALSPARRDGLLDAAREVALAHGLHRTAGATAPHDKLVALRVLAPRVEPAMSLLTAVWARWREVAWGTTANVPRVWRT